MKKGLFFILSLTLTSFSVNADTLNYVCGTGNDYESISITTATQDNQIAKVVSVSAGGKSIDNVVDYQENISAVDGSIELKLFLASGETIEIKSCEK